MMRLSIYRRTFHLTIISCIFCMNSEKTGSNPHCLTLFALTQNNFPRDRENAE